MTASGLSVAVIFGGRSVEHEVSVVSARGVVAALRDAGFTPVPVGVTHDGTWLAPDASAAVLDSDAERVVAADGDARLLLDPGRGRFDTVDVDVAFPLIHGWGGEDGKLQGTLETMGLPYVGAGVMGSSMAMDKIVTKQMLETHGIPVTPGIAVNAADYAASGGEFRDAVAEQIGFPVFVKPANGGSSVGVSRVAATDGLEDALARAFACDRRILVEQAIEAREIECAVIGGDDVMASGLGEIEPAGGFYDYHAKYVDDRSRLLIPAPLDPALTSTVREHAVQAFRVLDLWGLARIDFLVDRASGEVHLNEINTLPGFTPISMFSKLWEAAGIGFPELVTRLVDLALERAANERELRRTKRD